MVALNFDATQIAPNQGGTSVVPSGVYDVVITHSEMKRTSRGDGTMLIFTYTITQGDHRGKRVIDRLNIQNPNQTAMEIAYGQLSAISHVIGRLRWQDTAELHNSPFKIEVAEVPRADDPSKTGNEIKRYMDAQGNGAQAQGAAPAPASQPAPPPPPQPEPQQPPAQPQQPQSQTWQPPAQPQTLQQPPTAPPAAPPAQPTSAPAAPWQTGAPAPQPPAAMGGRPPWEQQ